MAEKNKSKKQVILDQLYEKTRLMANLRYHMVWIMKGLNPLKPAD